MILNNSKIRDELWISTPIYFFSHIVCTYTLLPITLQLFPLFPLELINLFVSMLPLFVLLFFLSYRYGSIKKSDWLMKGKDFLVLFIAFILLFVFVATILLMGGGRSDLVQKINKLYGGYYLGAIIIVVVIGPLLEEIIYRKYIFEILNSRYNIFLSVVITVILNTLIHAPLDFASLIIYITYALFFTLVYINSKLAVSFIVHCILNAFSLHIAFR